MLLDLNGELIEGHVGGPANGPPVQAELTAMTRTNKEVPGRNPLEDATKMRALERIGLYLTMMVYNNTRDVPIGKHLRTYWREVRRRGYRNPAFNPQCGFYGILRQT
jgi:hypothetical protein